MVEPKSCPYCNQTFFPNKYKPSQKTCSNPTCQKKRQLENMKLWRGSHPDYFKYSESKGQQWLARRREKSKQWRVNNPDKIRQYRESNKQDYRDYMRDYMRKYRQKNKAQEAPSPEPPQTPPA